jgi:hypothetical protein
MIYQSDMKQVNIVYQAHSGEPSLHYDGPEGRGWMSSTPLPGMSNVYTGWYACQNPQPGDNIVLFEPVVVCPMDYDFEFLMKFNKVFGCFEKAFENSPIRDKFVKINYGTSFGENVDDLMSRWVPWN